MNQPEFILASEKTSQQCQIRDFSALQADLEELVQQATSLVAMCLDVGRSIRRLEVLQRDME